MIPITAAIVEKVCMDCGTPIPQYKPIYDRAGPLPSPFPVNMPRCPTCKAVAERGHRIDDD